MQRPCVAHSSLAPACRSRKAATKAVLPMPASPVTNTNWRLPLRAAASAASRKASSRSRANRLSGRAARAACAAGAAGAAVTAASSARGAGACSPSTAATKRKPTPCTVAMKRGAAASSPSATRSSRMARDRAASLTTVPAHTVSNSSALVKSLPGRDSSIDSSVKDLRVTATTVPSRRNWCSAASASKGPKRQREVLRGVVISAEDRASSGTSMSERSHADVVTPAAPGRRMQTSDGGAA